MLLYENYMAICMIYMILLYIIYYIYYILYIYYIYICPKSLTPLASKIMAILGCPFSAVFAKPVIVQDDGHFRQAIQEIRLLGDFHLHVLEIPRSSGNDG